ncbi:MAG TPA: hypothetical protein VIK46_05520 [Deferrimonas sp.]|jgi:hypothetical protein
MIPKPRSFRVPRNPIGLLILLAAFAAAAGCSNANTSGDGGGVIVNHVDASGNSIPGWLTPTGGTHANSATINYIANGGSSSCTECHGSDLGGGISRVSCFANTANCHHGTIAGWVAVPPAAQNHGVSAKKAPGSSGFASCQICHGNNFAGANIAPTCLNNAACHGDGVASPHARKPWRGSPYTHVTTDPANAPVCAKCHFPNSPNNPADHPATPAPAGTSPGCFNNTLCHGENPVPHPVDNAWAPAPPAAQPHGNDAKAALGETTGFAYCQECHGTTGADFAGGSSGVSCTNNPDAACHGSTVASPHARKPWRASAGSPYTHTTTVETGNAPVCAQCHFPNSPNNPANHPATPAPAGTAPGCFNSTLCHGPTFHLPGWDQATQHGPVAKQAPSTSGGFAFCQLCHGTGTDFSGGSVGFSCYTCHGVPAPHPAGTTWRNSTSPTHQTTDLGNAAVCAFCHQSNAGTPSCFGTTLCH